MSKLTIKYGIPIIVPKSPPLLLTEELDCGITVNTEAGVRPNDRKSWFSSSDVKRLFGIVVPNIKSLKSI